MSVFPAVYNTSWNVDVRQSISPTIYSAEVLTTWSSSHYKSMYEVKRYCNPPSSIKRRDEGKLPVNGTLEFVAVALRHGDRGPLQEIRNLSSTNCGAPSTPILEKYLQTMQQFQGNSEHLGPFNAFQLHPHTKACMVDELTLLGANQQLILGKALKEAYNDEHGLLNLNWKSSNINVYSSFYSRTFQSGIAFLFGFLPQFKLADISVRPSPGIIFCMSEYYCQCPLAQYLEQQERRLRYQFLLRDRKTVKTIQKLIGILQSYTEQNLFPDPFHMLDSLMLYACHKAPLPCIPGTNTCATFEDLHTLITHTIWVEKQLMANSTMKTYSIIKSQGLLMHLIDKIQNSIRGKDPTRFLLYSAHDLTISPLLAVLGIHQNGVVPYASHLTFEIFSITEDGSAQYGLKIVYKGKDVTKQVSFCKPHFESSKTWRSALQRTFCPLESFFEFVVHLVHSTGHASYKALCNSHI